MMIIERKEAGDLRAIKKWLLVYGRRKTGKTFLVENFLDYDEFFFVKRDRSIISKKDGATIDYKTLTNLLARALPDGKTVVVDEFHRLGEDFLDFVHSLKKGGRLILISSTLFLSRSLLSSHSPILGLFAEFPVGLIDLDDTVRTLAKKISDRKALTEIGVLLREPLAIDYYETGERPRRLVSQVIAHSIHTIPALIGEIFSEEERSLSAIYDGILRAVALDKTVSSEISSHLFSLGLLKRDDPSLIQQYLTNLVRFGILKKLSVYGKKKFIYKHISPLLKIFYYADGKYNISERTPSEIEMERIVGEVMPKVVEDSVREMLAKRFGLEESVAQEGDFEVDGCLLRFKKPEIALEVKWREELGSEEIRKIAERLGRLGARRKILFVPDKREVKAEGIEVMDVLDLV
jgi:hypothetical protein